VKTLQILVLDKLAPLNVSTAAYKPRLKPHPVENSASLRLLVAPLGEALEAGTQGSHIPRASGLAVWGAPELIL
jgi:hypothetical protein